MKSLFLYIVAIACLIVFPSNAIGKDVNRFDDLNSVLNEHGEFVGKSEFASANDAKLVTEVKPYIATESPADETKAIGTTPVAEVISSGVETKLLADDALPVPVAIPVLSPEEAIVANKDAKRNYYKKKIFHFAGDSILVAISILCIAFLIHRVPFGRIKHIRLLHIWDLIGWAAISFVVMYCVLLIFQIHRPGYEFLTSLQPILTSSSFYLLFVTFILFILVYIKVILPYLLNCRIYTLFIIELLFSGLIGGLIIYHFSDIEPISDFKALNDLATEWQTVPLNELKRKLYSNFVCRRVYYSYYLIYKVFGCNYLHIEISQLFMHLVLGINAYFLAKQCINQEKIARLSMILYYFMPVQYLYMTIPSLDLWGGMFLCFNANLAIYLFKKCPELRWYRRTVPVASTPESGKFFHKIRHQYISFMSFFRRLPWLVPMLVSILLGITIFWMEMVRNLQALFCIPMFLFLAAVLVRRILSGKLKLFSRTMLFVFILCLFAPFLSNKLIQKVPVFSEYEKDLVPAVTVVFNAPDEIREVVPFHSLHMQPMPERRKDLALDFAVSYWHLYPEKYSQYLGTKMICFSNLFHPHWVNTPENLEKYPQEFTAYSFLVWVAKTIFMPLLLIGILCILFFKKWNSLAYVPIVLFFFFFIVMPTVGECQVRYTSLYYAPMCVCASCIFLLSKSKKVSLFNKQVRWTLFTNSILWGVSCIIVFLFSVTTLFSSSSFLKKYQLINFHDNQRQISSGEHPVAYKEVTNRNYLLSSVFHPAVAGVIPEETYVEWTIPEQTTEGLEYVLYGYLIVPLKANADFVVKINDTLVWDNSVFIRSRDYANSIINISNEKIVFLDNLKFTAKKENILRVEIAPKNKSNVDFALSAWGMVPSN